MKGTLNQLKIEESIDAIYNQLSERNKAFIDDFLINYVSNLVPARINKYKTAIVRWADLIEKDFDELTERDTLRANVIINNKKRCDYHERTIQDFVSEIKGFYKTMFGNGKRLPENIEGLKSPKLKGKLRLPEKMLSEDDTYKMIKACSNSRDRFYIALSGLDCGIRPIEARRMKFSWISKDEHGFFIRIKTAKDSGDKDYRCVRIIKSEPYYIQWLKKYPKIKNEDDFVFINYSNLKPIGNGTITALFKRLSKKLGFKVFPYLLRHSYITRMTKNPKVSMELLKASIGHCKRSNTIAEYIHYDDEDLLNMGLEANGIIKPKTETEPERKPVVCPKCKQSNEFDSDFCSYCNTPISEAMILKGFNEFDEMKKQMQGFKDVQEKFNLMLEAFSVRDINKSIKQDEKKILETEKKIKHHEDEQEKLNDFIRLAEIKLNNLKIKREKLRSGEE